MVELSIDPTQVRVELGELVTFIAKVKKLTYGEAEVLLPCHMFETEACICDDWDDMEGWNDEVILWLIDNELDVIYVYQD